MPTSLTPPSYHTSRRPLTAPQSRDPQQFQLSIGRRFDLPPSRPCIPLNRAKASDFPPFGTSERSIEYFFDEAPFLSPPTRSAIQDKHVSVDHQGILVTLTSSFPGKTQTEWKFLHDRRMEHLSTLKRQRNGHAQSTAASVNTFKNHLVMSRSTPPPAYASSEALDTPFVSDVPAIEHQVGIEVAIEAGRPNSATHVVPTLRYPYPSQDHEVAVTHGQAADAGSATNPPAETSESSGHLSLGGRIVRGTRRIFYHGLDPPPRPPRSRNRPSTADATLQSLSTSSTVASHLTAPHVDAASVTSAQRVEASPPSLAPQLPILPAVHEREQDQAMPISPMNLAPSQEPSPGERSQPDAMPPTSSLSSRWTNATAPSREDLQWNGTPETGRNFPDAFPLERLQSQQSGHRPPRQERPRHSRQSEGMINLQLASNLAVEASTDPGVHLRTPVLARSPDLSPWYTIISPSSSLHLPPDAESSNSSDSNSASSRRPLHQGSIQSPAVQRGLPNFSYFGGGSVSRRSPPSGPSASSRRISVDGLTTRSPPDLPTTLATTNTESTAPPAGGTTVPPSDPLSSGTFASATTSQEEQEKTGSSTGMRSPGSWTNEPLRLSRTRSSHRGSDMHEQVLTPKSAYSPSLQSAHDGHDTRHTSPFPRSRPRSPNIATRLLGSNDSGAVDQRPAPASDDHDDKQAIQPSTTLGTVSSESHYSSFHSFSSDTRLVDRKDNAIRSTVAKAVNAPKGTTFSASKLLANAERFNATSAYDRMRHPPPVPESYRNYKPNADDDRYALSTLSSPVPGTATIPPAIGTPIEVTPVPLTVHQISALEHAAVPKAIEADPSQETQPVQRQDVQLGVGLGILVPDDSPGLQHSASASVKPWDNMIDRIIAGKAKEKKSDAQEHLRKQKESIFRKRTHLIAARAEGLPGFRNKRRSSQPIMLGGVQIPETTAEARRNSAQLQAKASERHLTASQSSGRAELSITAGEFGKQCFNEIDRESDYFARKCQRLLLSCRAARHPV